MQTIIISSVFPPEPIVSSQTSSQIVSNLISSGHSIKVITSFPNRPGGEIFPGYKLKLFRKEKSTDNIDIIRCWSIFSRKSTLLSRLVENISFGITSSAALIFLSRQEVIYVNTWPIFAAGMVSVIARLRKIPVILSVQDLYPESLVSQGRMSSNGFLVHPKSPEEIANALMKLYKDPDLLTIFSKRSFVHYRKNFTQEVHLRSMKKIIWEEDSKIS